ncbi:MAG: gas vesicle protein GvpJ [Mycobacteriales bacterium]
MTTAVPAGGGPADDRPSPTGLADVIDTILDKGMVIDAYVRVSLVGIELLTVDARVVVASVDTYLRYAEAVNRLDLSQTEEKGLPELLNDVNEGGAKHKTKGALEAAGETLRDVLGGREDGGSDHETSRSGGSGQRRSRRED